MPQEEDTVAILHVEKLGGLANFGGIHARIRSCGQFDIAALSAADQQVVDSLFNLPDESKVSKVADGFRFRISRATVTGTETVEIPEELVPAALVSCVKDEFK
jgi:CRISPR/Cas system CMR-associated protein Cmr1 (group 7 of RAMP superfamily)